jgi:hypothetical protein
MNKQELIDKYIDNQKGVWCNSDVNAIGINTDGGSVYNLINGYQWGVEYPTNGKKPDLPDDCIVMYWTSEVHTGSAKSGCLDWSTNSDDCYPIIRFKITDERYKPVEPNHIPEASKMVDWYDYENQRAIKLPPIDGNECEYYDSDHGWQSCKVLMHYLDGVIIDGVEGVRFSIYTFRPKDHATRKADIERKRVVGAVYTIIDQHEGTILESVFDLYDKGYLRMPEDK